MRFYFDIDDDIFRDEFGIDFKNAVKEAAIYSVAETIFSSVTADSYYSDCSQAIKQLIKDRSGEIVDRVVERVAENIARKKAVLELTPKASQLAAIDRDNIAYFETMIDKAIAKRFGK